MKKNEVLKIQFFKDVNTELKKQNKNLLKELAQKEKELLASARIKKTPQTLVIRPMRTSKIQTVPFILASDWHSEEEVKLETVSNLNEFNLKIADTRIQLFFNNSVKLLSLMKTDTNFNTVVLALLGDFISGNIHEALLPICQLPPIEAVMWVQKRIIAGIEFLLKETPYKFIIPCCVGNHSRITGHMLYIATEKGNALETFMYYNLLDHFRSEGRVQFMIADGYHLYLSFFGRDIRLHHGHSIRFNKNVGGIFPTVYKAIMQWNKGKRADLDVFGHFHSMRNGGNFIVNGSLIGYNTYAVFITAEYEKPRQKFFMYTNGGEVVGEYPVFLDEVGG